MNLYDTHSSLLNIFYKISIIWTWSISFCYKQNNDGCEALFIKDDLVKKKDGTLKKGISLYKSYRSFNDEMFVKRKNNSIDE